MLCRMVRYVVQTNFCCGFSVYIDCVVFYLLIMEWNDVYCITMPVMVFLYTFNVWLLLADLRMECCVFVYVVQDG
jgi:hypothetical protein